MAKSIKFGEAAFLYLTHSVVVSHFETALSLRPRAHVEKAVSDPPKNRGGM